ncbi:unnamed protein product [Clavelina lepadiformis]|uniref:RRM domain-containing protein n=1 Tax=Clavelina lepadiformis TaxID=159417 RepID=A0ABP0GAS1_CLALP
MSSLYFLGYIGLKIVVMSGRRIFVGRLSYRARESDIEKFFKGFGRINEINIKTGFCFVEFDDPRDADDAVYEMNNQTLCGERVTVEHAKGAPRRGGGGYGGHDRGGYDRGRDYGRDHGRDYRDSGRYNSRQSRFAPPMRTDYRVIVENLSSRVSWQDLKDYLRQAGEITYADAHKHRRNEGVVDFASYDDMKKAIEKLDNTELSGRNIRLVEDKPTRSYSRSRSRSKSRSKSRSASRSRSRRRSRSPLRKRSRRRSTRSRSASRSRSRSRQSRSHSRSRSPSLHKEENGEARQDEKSRSASRSRSKSKTPEQEEEKQEDKLEPEENNEKPEENSASE